MPSTHAKIFRITQDHFKKLCKAVEEHPYNPKRREGFVVLENSGSRLVARCFFTRMAKVAGINPESLEPEVEEVPVLASTTFEINSAKGLIRTNDKRGDLKYLEEVLFGMGGARFQMEDYNSDVVDVFQNLRNAYGKLDLRNLRIKDYLGREGILTTANFKLLEPGNENDIFRRWQDEAQAFSATLMIDGQRQTIAVGRKGSIRYSDNLPEDILELALGFLGQCNVDVEVETVEV